MKTITVSEVKDIVKHLVIGLNKAAIFRGRFGAGKSAGVNQSAQELNEKGALIDLLGEDTPYKRVEVIDVRLGQYDSVDLRGFPHPDKATGTAIWYPPGTLPFIGNDSFNDEPIYLLFLDEFTSATAAVFAVCYQLILDRCIGEHVLRDNVRICMAGNLDDDKGIVNKTPMPLNNRMAHFKVENTRDEFCAYAQSVGVPPVFIAFWRFREALINNYNPKESNPVVATQRSWFSFVDIYTSKMPYHIKEACLVATIGEGPTMEFLAFAAIWKTLVPIGDILANPEKVAVPPEDQAALRYAMAMHVSGNMTPKTVDQLHKYLVRLPPEFAVMAWQLATERDKTLFSSKAYMDYVQRYRDVYKS